MTVAEPNYWMVGETTMILSGVAESLALYDIIEDRLSGHLFLAS